MAGGGASTPNELALHPRVTASEATAAGQEPGRNDDHDAGHEAEQRFVKRQSAEIGLELGCGRPPSVGPPGLTWPSNVLDRRRAVTW